MHFSYFTHILTTILIARKVADILIFLFYNFLKRINYIKFSSYQYRLR